MIKLGTMPFELYKDYYDLLYKDKDYKGEAIYVDKLIQKYNPTAKHIIELGSGTGNYSKPLTDLGYTITGIELSEEMNEIARAKAIPNFTPITDDISSFDTLHDRDVVVALFHVISYLTTNNQLINCFKKVAEHLKPRGVFIFDIWYSPAVYTQLPQARVKYVEDDRLSITRKANPSINYNENTVNVEYELIITQKENSCSHVLKESHLMRHFSTPEIELIAETNGYRLLASEEFLTARKPGKDTWGVCYILQKYE